MDNSSRKRMGAGAALLFLSPALVAALSGCGGSDCDRSRSTPSTSDDCGTGRRSGYVGGSSGANSGSGQVAPRSGGFGGFGRFFSGGG